MTVPSKKFDDTDTTVDRFGDLTRFAALSALRLTHLLFIIAY